MERFKKSPYLKMVEKVTYVLVEKGPNMFLSVDFFFFSEVDPDPWIGIRIIKKLESDLHGEIRFGFGSSTHTG